MIRFGLEARHLAREGPEPPSGPVVQQTDSDVTIGHCVVSSVVGRLKRIAEVVSLEMCKELV